MARPASLSELLQDRASRQPEDVAYNFIDYEADPTGISETLTWSQVYQRVQVIAEELSTCGSIGDRAAIVAPQGLEYIMAFLGALHAGFIAVPLPLPQFGVHEERVHSALRDCAPSVILTTASAAGEVAKYADGCHDGAAAAVIEIDSLDPEAQCRLEPARCRPAQPAYLQYTSGSTRRPTGVMISHRNVMANFQQWSRDLFPADTQMTVVSWLPFYHDLGLMMGVCQSVLTGFPAVLMSPIAFVQQPARWIRLLATNRGVFTAAPNFAFELAARKTTDEDMAGLDLGNLLIFCSGGERVQPATLQRFTRRFAPFNLPEAVIRPTYGLAETVVYVSTRTPAQPPEVVDFGSEELSAGLAERRRDGGTALVSYGFPVSPMVRIVDPDTRTERPAGTTGEIWVHGENVAMGYWRKAEQTEQTFRASLVDPPAGTPVGPWLRTGDLGVMSEGELFIIGRIEDLLIVDGSNHYPDDIEATIHEITKGRAAAVAVPNEGTEQVVAIAEIKTTNGSGEDQQEKLRSIKYEVTSAISNSHGLRLADLVFVGLGAIPTTTSGKVRRSACAERYRRGEFERVEVTP
ncbi:AMP-binding protein [Mycobacterium attenuatum]|uniref:AMP-binding protein n=1 Tax=Mycobacterium attenuatum TaxID=2341086 RepID=UPI000F026E43|nr:AMP-binding protein [Mycobacterium attenuatum]VBA61057.1 4-hydroxyphenylalkanoate adenylyltransferase [Mycobacterium attenuatum]